MACKEAVMEQETTSLVASAKDFLIQQGIDSYLVGGYVRDTLLGRPTRDIDIAVTAKAPEVAQKLAAALDGKYVLLDEVNEMARVVLSELGPLPGEQWHFDLSTIEGDIETNLARRRAFSDRHAAYYRRRAAGGAGIVVTETASVHPSDWPYERAPLAAESATGWASIAQACHAEGALAIASIGHAGGQGSSAYSQQPLLAPSRVPEVDTREVPKAMEAEDISRSSCARLIR